MNLRIGLLTFPQPSRFPPVGKDDTPAELPSHTWQAAVARQQSAKYPNSVIAINQTCVLCKPKNKVH